MNNSGDLILNFFIFSIGAVLTQILIFIVLGAFNSAPAVENLNGEWKSMWDNIQTTTIIGFAMIDICGGIGLIATFNSLVK